jgi:hypothetical protein
MKEVEGRMEGGARELTKGKWRQRKWVGREVCFLANLLNCKLYNFELVSMVCIGCK